ncbi:MAG: TIGR03364 family FAD-dependent oxidoreductase [Bacteroidota bacterium]
MKKYDLIVVGAGNLGVFHAYHALKMGKKVLLLERDSAPNEATVRNFGQIVPSGQSLNGWFDYGRESLKIYNEIQKKTDISIRKNGSYYFASDEDELLLLYEAAYLFAERDYKVKLLSSNECVKNVEGLKKKYVKGGIYFPKELSTEPRLMIHLIINYLIKSLGLEYLNNTNIIGVDIVKNLVQATTSNQIKILAEKAVICNGYDFKTLFPEIFSKSEMQICKLQMMQTHPQRKFEITGNILTGLSIRRYDSFKSCKSYPFIKKTELHDLYDNYGIHILFKQAIDGSIIIGDSHEYTDINNNSSLDFGNSLSINELILDEAKKIFNFPHWIISNYWSGYYAKTKDDNVFEYSLDNKIFISTGIGGKGMTTAPGYTMKNIQKMFETT